MRAPVLALALLAAQPATAQTTSCLPSSVRGALAKIQSRFGVVRIISTHRPGAHIAGSGRVSLHASCRAVDFQPSPGRTRAVVRWLEQNYSGGIGTYSGSLHHIHIDNGPRVRFHRGS